MKTIYLKSKVFSQLVDDIRKVIPDYIDEIESEDNGIYCHYIGDIVETNATFNKDLTLNTPAVMVGAYHANLLVSNDFDESIFKTKITTPKTPSHKYAI
ncbi:MAG: hypothetical protein EBZ58_12920 [Bacteroidetes bacterium]|nr:hypothetical protein [Bacteroidota bacterium]